MYTFSLLFTVIILATTTIVWSLPIGSTARPARTTTFKVSEEAKVHLIKIGTKINDSLVPLMKKAKSLTKETWLTAEYQRWEHKVCRGRIFNTKAQSEVCKDRSFSTLRRHDLTQYYNEFVIHLKVSEHNFNTGIAKEIKVEDTQAALKNENIVIRILKESILPTLEFMLQLGSTDTNCSTTELIANRKIAQYANCTIVQTSNIFLSQTALNLWYKLNSTDVQHLDNTTQYKLQVPDSTKQWCLTL